MSKDRVIPRVQTVCTSASRSFLCCATWTLKARDLTCMLTSFLYFFLLYELPVDSIEDLIAWIIHAGSKINVAHGILEIARRIIHSPPWITECRTRCPPSIAALSFGTSRLPILSVEPLSHWWGLGWAVWHSCLTRDLNPGPFVQQPASLTTAPLGWLSLQGCLHI